MTFELLIRKSASHDDVQVTTNRGTVRVDMSTLSIPQKIGVRELVVDSFCDHFNFRRVYNKDVGL